MGVDDVQRAVGAERHRRQVFYARNLADECGSAGVTVDSEKVRELDVEVVELDSVHLSREGLDGEVALEDTRQPGAADQSEVPRCGVDAHQGVGGLGAEGGQAQEAAVGLGGNVHQEGDASRPGIRRRAGRGVDVVDRAVGCVAHEVGRLGDRGSWDRRGEDDDGRRCGRPSRTDATRPERASERRARRCSRIVHEIPPCSLMRQIAGKRDNSPSRHRVAVSALQRPSPLRTEKMESTALNWRGSQEPSGVGSGGPYASEFEHSRRFEHARVLAQGSRGAAPSGVR